MISIFSHCQNPLLSPPIQKQLHLNNVRYGKLYRTYPFCMSLLHIHLSRLITSMLIILKNLGSRFRQRSEPFGDEWGPIRYTSITRKKRRYIHTYIHTCMHTYIHTYIHAYIHTYIMN